MSARRHDRHDAAQFVLRVNGTDHEVRDSWLGESLLDVLRDRLGLMGTKGACEQGECGSCSVLVDDQLVCSCLVMAASAVAQPIVTVEGLGGTAATSGAAATGTGTGMGDMTAATDVQRAFVEFGGVQCGFCTPGLIVAVHDLLERIAQPTDTEIREELAGNVCRCTGYGRIIEAVQQVAVRRRAAGGRR